MNPVSFQINLAPGDYRHAKYLLEHQIETFYNQVGEIQLTYDKNPKKILSEDELEKFHNPFIELINKLKQKYPNVNLNYVDYSPEIIEEVSKKFFKKKIETHDFRGAPVYAYLYGIAKCKYDYVLHIDSDMFFGGLSSNWINEAIEKYKSDKEILYISPLPGPPHPNNILIGQGSYTTYKNENYCFEFDDSVSTRIFFTDRSRLYGNLIAKLPPIREIVFASIAGFPLSERLEQILYFHLKRNNFKRVDFLGSGNGMYSVHPDYRSEEFYNSIPEMINRLKHNIDIPESQKGFYNFSDDFIDWGDALEKYQQKRLRSKIKKIFSTN